MRIDNRILAQFGFIRESRLEVRAGAAEALGRIDRFLQSGGYDDELNRSFKGQIVGNSFQLTRRHVFEESSLEGEVSDVGRDASIVFRASCSADVGRFCIAAPAITLVGAVVQQYKAAAGGLAVSYFLTSALGGALVGLFGLFFGGLRGRSFNMANIGVLERVVSQDRAT